VESELSGLRSAIIRERNELITMKEDNKKSHEKVIFERSDSLVGIISYLI
jgi:hypothetical protein